MALAFRLRVALWEDVENFHAPAGVLVNAKAKAQFNFHRLTNCHSLGRREISSIQLFID